MRSLADFDWFHMNIVKKKRIKGGGKVEEEEEQQTSIHNELKIAYL